MRSKQFHTGLVSTDYPRYPATPYHGKGWSVQFSPMPSTFPGQTFEVSFGRKYRGKEVTITATTQGTAERAANLIHGAMFLVEGSSFFSHLLPGENSSVYPSDGYTDLDDFLKEQYRSTSHVPLACLIAAKASRRLSFVYALAKLRLSYELLSAPGMALNPSSGPNIPKSHLPEDHVRLAYAIVLANACIEELGLRVPAHQNKQSWINGDWNPEVKQEFEGNLQRSKIDLKEPFYWNIRGGKTKIEGKRPPRLTEGAPWTRQNVRDGAMQIIDAVACVGWLRSNVAAHTAKQPMLKVLSVYDVANAQFLARRLLMETMEVWRYWGGEYQPVSAESVEA